MFNIIICNFTPEVISYEISGFEGAEGKLVISNYQNAAQVFAQSLVLKPYGAYVYEFKK